MLPNAVKHSTASAKGLSDITSLYHYRYIIEYKTRQIKPSPRLEGCLFEMPSSNPSIIRAVSRILGIFLLPTSRRPGSSFQILLPGRSAPGPRSGDRRHVAFQVSRSSCEPLARRLQRGCDFHLRSFKGKGGFSYLLPRTVRTTPAVFGPCGSSRKIPRGTLQCWMREMAYSHRCALFVLPCT